MPNAKAPIRDLFAGMNGTEKQRAVELEALKRSGQIADWWFEAFTFKMADDLRLTPDFVVQQNDGTLEVEEIKGFWREDARVKIRMAAARFPFRFRAFQLVPKRDGGGWKIEEF